MFSRAGINIQVSFFRSLSLSHPPSSFFPYFHPLLLFNVFKVIIRARRTIGEGKSYWITDLALYSRQSTLSSARLKNALLLSIKLAL